MELCVCDILTFDGWWKQSRRIEILWRYWVWQRRRGCGRVEKQRKTLFITVKHNMITRVVKTQKPQTHSSSARRRPRWVWQRAHWFQIARHLPWSRNCSQRGLQLRSKREMPVCTEREKEGEKWKRCIFYITISSNWLNFPKMVIYASGKQWHEQMKKVREQKTL